MIDRTLAASQDTLDAHGDVMSAENRNHGSQLHAELREVRQSMEGGRCWTCQVLDSERGNNPLGEKIKTKIRGLSALKI